MAYQSSELENPVQVRNARRMPVYLCTSISTQVIVTEKG